LLEAIDFYKVFVKIQGIERREISCLKVEGFRGLWLLFFTEKNGFFRLEFNFELSNFEL